MRSENHELLTEVVKQLREDLSSLLKEEDKAEKWRIIKRIERYTADVLEKMHGEQPTDEQFGRFIDILFKCQELSNYDTPGGWAPSMAHIKEWIDFLDQYYLKS